MNKKKEELSILVISDVHGDSFQFDNIKQIAKTNNKMYDYIFYLGDFDSLYIEEQSNKETIQESLNMISQMLLLLETLSPNVYYIGGNHDPGVLFTDNAPQLGKTSKNIHKKYIVIGDDLIIAGLGGSTPSIQTNSETFPYHNFHIDSYDNIIWKGYPYSNNLEKESYKESDSLYGKDLTELYESIPNHHQIILVLN